MLLTAGAGYGKTTLLEQALDQGEMPVAWISCSETERAPEVLLKRLLDAISRAAPGASDVLAEQLAFPPEAVDPFAAVRELLSDLPRLLVEPLVLVIDDAEHLEGAEGSLRLLSELVRAELALLHVAIAGRRPLKLRVAKARAAGRLTELTATDLAFDSEECAQLLRRTGYEPSTEEVDGVISATEGWPLGIALMATHLLEGRGDLEGVDFRDLRSARDLRSFFSEELLDSLTADLREAALRSSVAQVVTAEVARALDLPAGFEATLVRAGMLVRSSPEGKDAFAFHPLLREFLLERLDAELGEDECRRLHGSIAQVMAEAGEPIEAIEHWLKARSWPEAVSKIELEGPVLVRSSPGQVRRWLSLLPADERALPTIRSLEGQLEWATGDNVKAIELLRASVRGFREHPNAPADWLARSVLVDSLFATGALEVLDEVVEGWDQPEAEPAGPIPPAVAMYAAVVLAAFARFDEAEKLAKAARSHPQSDLIAPLDALLSAFADGPRGDLDESLAIVNRADRELQRFDPLNRRPHLLGAAAVIIGDRGEPEEALRLWAEIREIVRGGTAPLLADATHAWCALLHAQAGRLAEAEAELARHQGHETGYRSYIAELAPAVVASLRGDTAATLEYADRALAVVAGGPILFRSWVGIDLVPALAAVGRLERADEVLEQTIDQVDELVPGPRGRLHRGRLLALRAWLRHCEGDPEGADSCLDAFWKNAEGSLRFNLRREWVRLQPILWSALERGSLDPEPTLEAIAEAFPDGLPLVAFLDHPLPAVRRAALGPATESGDPAALEHLRRLAEDPDADMATAASRAAQRLSRALPPLRIELLGTFAVGRGSWRAGDWERPVDARLARFLLVHLGEPVPEDVIFDALWPDLSASSARKSLQVAASRARGVLDPPGTQATVLESADRCYRLMLGARDQVDAEQFQDAAAAALAEVGDDRRRLLARARELWGGEPLQEERYSDWAAAYREGLSDQYTQVLAALVEIRQQAGEHAEAAEVARDLVDLDPLNEGGHRALITSYARTGRTGRALRQYLECRRALVDELGVEPAAATSRLQARILAGEPV